MQVKDVQTVAATLGNSALAASPIWRQDATTVSPAQLSAFKLKLSLDGRGCEAQALIRQLLDALSAASAKGELSGVKALDYAEPLQRMTVGAFTAALETLERPRPAAIIFALESGLHPEQIASLTWQEVSGMRTKGLLNDRAWEMASAQVRHIRCKHVFWQFSGKAAVPLFGLERDAFDAFGLVWGELELTYRRLIPVLSS